MIPLKPGDKATDDHVRQLIDEVNRIDEVVTDQSIALIALANAIARQPQIDRAALHADFIEIMGTHIVGRYGTSRELNGLAATVAYYLHRPD